MANITLFGYKVLTDDTSNNRLWTTNDPVEAGNISVATANPGTNYTAFADTPCRRLTIANDTTVAIEVRQGGSGVAIPIANNATFTFNGITNADQLQVKRVDNNNTPVTVKARWEN